MECSGRYRLQWPGPELARKIRAILRSTSEPAWKAERLRPAEIKRLAIHGCELPDPARALFVAAWVSVFLSAYRPRSALNATSAKGARKSEMHFGNSRRTDAATVSRWQSLRRMPATFLK